MTHRPSSLTLRNRLVSDLIQTPLFGLGNDRLRELIDRLVRRGQARPTST